MKITESALRKIVRQEAQRLAEAAPQSYAPGAAPHFSYREKARRIDDALEILEELNRDEERLTGEADADLENLIESLSGYLEAVEALAANEPAPSHMATFSDPSRTAWKH